LKRSRFFPAAAAIFGAGTLAAGCTIEHRPGPLPEPTPVCAAAFTRNVLATSAPTTSPSPIPGPSGPVTSFTPRPGSAIVNSQYAIGSNPAGLVVKVNTVAQGITPQTLTPAFSAAAYAITITPSDCASPYTYTTDQTADGNKTVYYNQNADTSGSIGSVSMSAVARTPQSIINQSMTGTPRFGVARLAGRPLYSSTRVAVHYLASALVMGGRHAQDVERFEGVARAVPIGFERGGQVTRIADVPSGQSVVSLVAHLKNHSEVVGAEPLQLRYKTSSTAVLPNDTHFNNYEQWDMFRIGAPNAWGYSEGTPQTGNTPSPSSCTITSGNASTPNPAVGGIAIAMLDTGIDNNQQDLQGGKVVYGEKVVDGVVTCGVAAAQDTDGHGTNVTGIAAADTNNGLGFAGVGFNVSIQIYKIFNDGPTNSISANTGDEAQAIYDAVAHGARVISLSLGGSQAGGFDAVERDAVEYAVSQNVAVVAAAGNEAATTLDFPAGYDGVISVGATSLNDSANYKNYATATDVMASYSNAGPRLTVVAPGRTARHTRASTTCTGSRTSTRRRRSIRPKLAATSTIAKRSSPEPRRRRRTSRVPSGCCSQRIRISRSRRSRRYSNRPPTTSAIRAKVTGGSTCIARWRRSPGIPGRVTGCRFLRT